MPKASKTRTVVIDESRMQGGAKSVGGSKCDDFNYHLARQALAVQWVQPDESKAGRDQITQHALGFLVQNEPKDELEGMLLAQMLAMHSAAMECSRRAMIPQQIPQHRDQNLNAATKASRTFLMQLEALQRYSAIAARERNSASPFNISTSI